MSRKIFEVIFCVIQFILVIYSINYWSNNSWVYLAGLIWFIILLTYKL